MLVIHWKEDILCTDIMTIGHGTFFVKVLLLVTFRGENKMISLRVVTKAVFVRDLSREQLSPLTFPCSCFVCFFMIVVKSHWTCVIVCHKTGYRITTRTMESFYMHMIRICLACTLRLFSPTQFHSLIINHINHRMSKSNKASSMCNSPSCASKTVSIIHSW